MNINSDRTKLNIHFAIPIVTLLVITVYFIGMLTLQINMVNLLSGEMFRVMDVFFDISLIICFFMVFNTAYYSYVSFKRTKMFFLAFIFLITGVMATMLFIYKTALSDPGSQLYYIYNLTYEVIFIIGLFIAGMINSESVIGVRESTTGRIVPILAIVLIVMLQFFNLTSMDFQLNDKTFLMIRVVVNNFKLIVVIATLALSLRTYLRTLKETEIYYLVSLIIIGYGYLLKIFFFDNLEYLLAYKLLNIIGLAVMFSSIYIYSIHEPVRVIASKEEQLKLYAQNLEKIIDKRTLRVRDANQRLISELEYAKKIQQSLLPMNRLNFRNTTFVSEYFPCERLSGDFFDIYKLDDENVGRYVLDVSGHGISAALMTMFCNHFIKSSERLIKRYRGLKPHRNLMHFYQEFNKMNFPEEMHMVIFYASFNLTTKVLTYSSGGMNCNPLVIRRNGTHEFLDKSSGFPICKLSDFFTPEYSSARINLEPGDRVMFYTDGLIDHQKNNCFSLESLIEFMMDNRKESIRSINLMLEDHINPKLEHLEDDITYFIMEV